MARSWSLRAKFDQLHQFVTEQITHARQAEDTNRMPEPEAAAAELLALLDGLGAQILAGCRTPETADELFDQRLDATLPDLDQ